MEARFTSYNTSNEHTLNIQSKMRIYVVDPGRLNFTRNRTPVLLHTDWKASLYSG
jgi:hypothetical protein